MNDSFKYSVFLSYSHEDERWANWLHRALESYRVPSRLAQIDGRELPRRIAPVFRDRDELPSAASLSAAVNQALQVSESMVVICSPNAVASKWVNEEISTFKQLGRATRIFCVIVDGEPNAGDENECFPEALRFEFDGDGRISARPAEPIAADARPGADSRAIARLRLISGILDVGFDALRQRDLHRRQRQLLAITAGSVVVMLVTVTLAILAFLARAESEQRREQAEDLIGFMVGDLRTRLQEVGRLDVFMSVGNKVMDYFAALRDEDVSDSMLGQRARVLRQIGTIRMDQGRSDAAIDAFRESLTLSSRLVERDPENADWQIALANSHFYIGFVNWQRGHISAARAEFEAVLPIVDAVVARDPDNADLLAEQAYAYTNIGRVLEVEGEFEEALGIYQIIMTINQRLFEMHRDNVDFQLEVGFAHNNMGKLVATLGRLEEAEHHYNQDLAIKMAVVEGHPQHNLWRYYLALSHAFVARIDAARGDTSGAQEHFNNVLEIMRELLRLDSSQLVWRQLQLNTQRQLSTVLRRLGQIDEASDMAASATEGFGRLVAQDPENAAWAEGLATARMEAARLEMQRGNGTKATAHARFALQTFETLLEQAQGNRELQGLRVEAELTVGDVAVMRNDVAAAESAWRSALKAVERDSAQTSNPVIIDLRATLLGRLGRETEARPLVARLQTMGYQSRFVDVD
jgi:tetratricopeptide (TPR) repeat protein